MQLNLKIFQNVKENKNRIHPEEKLHKECIGGPVTWRVYVREFTGQGLETLPLTY